MEVEKEYDYDDDYGDLFTKVLLNISPDDLANISLNDEQRNLSDQNEYPEVWGGTTDDHDEWLFVLNIVSGIAVLTNSILVFMIIVDFVIDRERRYWTRHWLLLNTSLTHVVYLSIGIYMREFGREIGKSEKNCVVFQHTEKTIEFVAILYLIVISLNVIGNIVRPQIPCGKKNLIFWVIFILFTMVCGNLAILAMFTMKIGNPSEENSVCKMDAITLLKPGNIHLITIVTFFVPYGIILILAFSSLVFSCVQQRKPARSFSLDNDFNTRRKHSVIFIFIASTAGFLLMVSHYLCSVPELSEAILSTFHIKRFVLFYGTLLVKLIYYVIFPVLCLCLKEIRVIYRKAVNS